MKHIDLFNRGKKILNLAGLGGLFLIGLTACSNSNSDPNFGLFPGSAKLNHEYRATNTIARGNDLAPPGSYTRAPKNGFSDRNYSRVQLNPQEALIMLNAYRAKHGLKKVTLDPHLTEAAKLHSRDLAKNDRISHYGADGSNPWDRVSKTGYGPQLAAENVGTGQQSLKEVFQGWKDSPGHNKNLLLKEAKHVGIALVYDPKTEYKTFWTMVLGRKI